MSSNMQNLPFEKSINENSLPVWIIKPDDYTFHSINDSAEKEFLYAEEELVGESILAVCPSFSFNEFIPSSHGSIEKNIAAKIRRKDGLEQPAKLEITNFISGSDNYFHIVVNPLVSTYNDSKELTDFFYSYSFDKSPVPVIILERSTFKIIQVNDGAIRMYGFSRDEFIGRSFTSILAFSESDYILKIFSAVKENKQNRFEIKQITNSGRSIDTEIFIQSLQSFGEELLVVVVHDISQKKLALRLLENSLNNYRFIANNSTDLIIRQNLEGKINYASPASVKLLGFTPGFLTINNIYNFIHPVDAEKIKAGIPRMTETSHYKTRYRIKNSANNYIWLESTATLLFDNNSMAEPEIISVSRDISDQVEVENKLIEANEKAKEIEKLKHILLANISHEMRTPLQSILGYSQSVKEKLVDGELAEDLDNIYENGQRLLRMINVFLNLSYMEANNFLPHFEIHDIATVVQSAAGPFFNLARKKNISLSVIPPAVPIYANTDKIILKDILDTLIDNSTKFTPSGYVKIVISEKRVDENDYAVIAIEDSGIGIAQGKEGLVMQEFRQISEGLNRNYEGIGLGLSVAKRLIERINGKMIINSSEGKGTSVKIYLMKEEVS